MTTENIVVRYVGKKNCSAPRYVDLINSVSPSAVVFDTISDRRNASFRATLDGHAVSVKTPSIVTELRELAAMVYVGDELFTRDAAWQRQIKLVLPSGSQDVWQNAERALSDALSFLSGDKFAFEWPRLAKTVPSKNHRRSVPKGYDVVCLFSGGVDSLLGAYHALVSGQRVLLVSHQTGGAQAQRSLFSQLRSRFGTNVRLVQFSMSLSDKPNRLFALPDTLELTHRTRSFLFLSLAVSVARAAQVNKILMPENGLIALNAPLQKSRIGSLSTRTAHPVFLFRFLTFAREAGAFEGGLSNPFLFESKTDMVENADVDARALLLETVSCAHPSRYNNAGVRHCGYCVPCLYRRAAFIQGGIDRPSDYYRDVLSDFASMSTETQIDFRALVNFAGWIIRSSDVAVDLRILSHGYFSPTLASKLGPGETDSLAPWREMIRRWAGNFLGCVDRLAKPEVKGLLGRKAARG
jgi:7-cyano-7-deazaguanine synthase in queuosine biosynthesis